MNIKNKNNVQLAVVGSIGLDTIETPSERRENLLGGSVSYACATASFFTRVGMVGIVGSDFPGEYMKLYKKFGIDLTGLKQVEGSTFKWSGIYGDDMNNRRTISTELNVFESFSPELPDAYRNAPFILLGNISPELQLHVFSQARNPRFVVADTMDMWINISRKPLMEVISKVNMLTLNDSEARLLTNEYNIKKCADLILDWGPQYVVIKKGECGSIMVSRAGVFLIPAYPVDRVVDPTGAGDSFAGGFMGALAGNDVIDDNVVRKALLYGTMTASFTVQDFSLGSLKELTNKDIENRLLDFQKMISI